MPNLDSAPSRQAPSTLAIVLRHATAELHAAVERLPLMARLTSTRVTRDDYLDYLLAMGRVYGSLEAPCIDALDERLRRDLGIRPKLPAILVDLTRHGLRQPHTRRDATRPLQTDQALGGLYVLEGATLGGRVIARHLRRCLGKTLGPTTFLDFHGEQTSQAWKGFSGVLNRRSEAAELDSRAVVLGAIETFCHIHHMLATAHDTGGPGGSHATQGTPSWIQPDPDRR